MNQLEYSQKNIEYFTDNEIINTPVGTEFIFDVECYSNYFLVAMKCLSNQKVITFEKSYHINTFNLDKLKFVLWRFCFIGFNSNFYDLPIITAALEDKTPEELHLISTDIIANSINPFAFEKKYKLHQLCLRPQIEKGVRVLNRPVSEYGWITGKRISKIQLIDGQTIDIILYASTINQQML